MIWLIGALWFLSGLLVGSVIAARVTERDAEAETMRRLVGPARGAVQ